MPLEYNVSNDGSFVHVTGSLSVTLDDILEYLDALEKDERISGKHTTLFDVRAAQEVIMTEPEVEQVAIRIQTNLRRLAATRIALVVPNRESFELARYFEELVKSFDENAIVFNDIQTAKTWLGVL